MTQRELRDEIFKILFERELIDIDIDQRIEETIEKTNMTENKIEFFREYIKDLIKNEDKIVLEIKNKLKGWTFERLGTVERTVLKMSFFEILIKKTGHEIVINEAVEITKIYGDIKTKEFVNGVLADLIEKTDN